MILLSLFTCLTHQWRYVRTEPVPLNSGTVNVYECAECGKTLTLERGMLAYKEVPR